MSRPMALPVGPPRRDDSSTSIPPPEPRSSTVSPAFSSASAVGLPQPSDASMASAGTAPACASSYRFDVIGSGSQQPDAPQPQVAFDPLRARLAASPYFRRTAVLIASMPPSPMTFALTNICVE